ncbi:transposase [Nostoc sp.]|uniref:transposase n=1 Tax=Nostoc sp. TaxID=1180 RepID=UPI002FF89BC1
MGRWVEMPSRSLSKNACFLSYGKSAVVVMDNVPAHKIAAIEPLIQSVGASVQYLSPYSPDFNPIEHWWLQLKAFLRLFSPTTTTMVDILIATALDLINPKHLKNWFINCCYCTS